MSRSAGITPWLTERSLKKAVCEASRSMWIPLIGFAARVSTDGSMQRMRSQRAAVK